MTIEKTLTERGNRYGNFMDHAIVTQAIKDVMQNTKNWKVLKPDQKEALDMIAHKIGRILNGDPDYIDSWHDIIGYTKLVETRLAFVDDSDDCPLDLDRVTTRPNHPINPKVK